MPYPPPKVSEYIIGENYCYTNGVEYPIAHCRNFLAVSPEDSEKLKVWNYEIQEKLTEYEE